jgi:endogenous inhibitor of DNA gyrase (YacG/DUF329 family)
MARMVSIKCAHCGKDRDVRAADVARGWGKFCDKRCKAKAQEARTGQYAAFKDREAYASNAQGQYDSDMAAAFSDYG